MKRIFTICCAFSLMLNLFAQNNKEALNKMDAQLKMWVTEPTALYQKKAFYKTGPLADPMISIIFKTNGSDPRSVVSKHKGIAYSVIGSICTAEIPLSQMATFTAEPEVIKIESAKEVQLHNDKGRQLIGVDDVQSGKLPGGHSYTGKGVIVGFVDTGIDFLNSDFRKKTDSTQTRIINIWDQTMNGGATPSGFVYGSEWTQVQINNELTHPGTVTQRDSMGHGTHVSGTAAGLRGVAYDADIIMVKSPLSDNGDYKFATTAKILDAVNYIYQKAAALNKPCVVNMSIGFGIGAPKDGSSLFEQGLDALVSSKDGFFICVSAGNDGDFYVHNGGYPLTEDSVWMYVNALNGATWYGITDRVNEDSLWVSVEMDSAVVTLSNGVINQSKIFQSPWMKLKDIKDTTGFTYTVFYTNGDTAGTIQIVASDYDSARTEFYINPRDKNILDLSQPQMIANLYKVIFKGGGSFHSWIQPLYRLAVNLPFFGASTDSSFEQSDNEYSIGVPATAHKVLAVGAYINKETYTDILGNEEWGQNYQQLSPGANAFFSSKGPTLDGRIKPEICAPGVNIASTLSRYAVHDSTEMVDANTIVFSGTSMSCPFTSGSLALYLEQNPQATFEALRAVLDSSTIRDSSVKSAGAIPNNTWGYGKLDIYKTMGSPFHTGIAETIAEKENLLVYPNPATQSVYMNLPENESWKTISVMDVNGRLMTEFSVKDKQVNLTVSSWPTGMYFYHVTGSSRSLNGKFLVGK